MSRIKIKDDWIPPDYYSVTYMFGDIEYEDTFDWGPNALNHAVDMRRMGAVSIHVKGVREND
jgi:hypothetical protein